MKNTLVLSTFCLLAAVAIGPSTPLRASGQERPAQEDGAKPAEGFTLKTAETITFDTDEVTWMQVGTPHPGRPVVREPADLVA